MCQISLQNLFWVRHAFWSAYISCVWYDPYFLNMCNLACPSGDVRSYGGKMYCFLRQQGLAWINAKVRLIFYFTNINIVVFIYIITVACLFAQRNKYRIISVTYECANWYICSAYWILQILVDVYTRDIVSNNIVQFTILMVFHKYTQPL